MAIQLTEARPATWRDSWRNAAVAKRPHGTKKSGCTGFVYVVDYADSIDAGDHVFESHGVKWWWTTGRCRISMAWWSTFVGTNLLNRVSDSAIPISRKPAAVASRSACESVMLTADEFVENPSSWTTGTRGTRTWSNWARRCRRSDERLRTDETASGCISRSGSHRWPTLRAWPAALCRGLRYGDHQGVLAVWSNCFPVTRRRAIEALDTTPLFDRIKLAEHLSPNGISRHLRNRRTG